MIGLQIQLPIGSGDIIRFGITRKVRVQCLGCRPGFRGIIDCGGGVADSGRRGKRLNDPFRSNAIGVHGINPPEISRFRIQVREGVLKVKVVVFCIIPVFHE